MKVLALEFKVGDSVFAVEMKDVKHLFEVEEIFKFPNMPKGMLGIVRYHNYVYPLISLRKLFNIEGKDSNIAFVLISNNKEYAILVDEILKIGEIEKKNNFLIEVFKDGDELIEKFNLEFLKNIDIPIFHNKKANLILHVKKNQKSFLVFECNDELYAFDIELIKKIEEYNGKNLILNESILPVESFSKIDQECEDENVLILENKKVLGVKVGDIIDVVFVDEDNLVKANGKFDRYFIYKNREVKVFNKEYVSSKVDKDGVFLLKKEEKKVSKNIEVLIVEAMGVKLAIRMSNIIGIYDYNEAKISLTSTSKYIKGILPTDNGAVYVISLEEVFNKKYNLSEDTKIIVLKHKTTKGLLVDKIDDLINVNIENIIEAQSTNYIGGMVLFKDKMIPLFNLNWPNDI